MAAETTATINRLSSNKNRWTRREAFMLLIRERNHPQYDVDQPLAVLSE
jgi:hypothetical protein